MKNIAVVSVNKNKYSETFIHSQIKHLPTRVHYFYGGYCPLFYNEGRSFIKLFGSENFVSRLLSRIVEKTNKNILLTQIATYCRVNNIEAILAHYGPTGIDMAAVSGMCNIPLYVYFHGYDIHRGNEIKKFGTAYKDVFEKSEKIFAVSKEIVRKLEIMGAPPEKVVYNPCGADMDLFKPTDASLNKPVFISVGRFDDTKNHEQSIRAFEKVAQKYTDAKLIFIGAGKNLSKCRRLVKTLGLGGQIVFKGALNHEQVAAELSLARAFVLHSVTTKDGDKEGSPVSIMEAGASALPVVATRHAGIKDIVEENITGFFVDENDIAVMADCMMRFIEEPLLAKQMGMAGYSRIEKYFSLKRNVALLWNHINKQNI